MMHTLRPSHPMHALAHRIEHVCLAQDAQGLAALLDGTDIPAISREGDEPAHVIWLCITRYVQPSPEWLDQFAKISATLNEQLKVYVSHETEELRVANGASYAPHAWGAFARSPSADWQTHESYVYNKLLLDNLQPAHPALFQSIHTLRETGLDTPVALQRRCPDALQSALIWQQTDTRLVDEWMDRLKEICQNLADAKRRAEALLYWRALAIAPVASDAEHELDGLDVSRLTQAASYLLGVELDLSTQHNQSVIQNTVVIDDIEDNRISLLLTAIALLPQIHGGTPFHWQSNMFEPATAWPSIVKNLASDIWPDDEAADYHLTSDIAKTQLKPKKSVVPREKQ